MIKKILIILTAIAALWLNMRQVNARLSTNPWADMNDSETVEEVYKKARKRNRGGSVTHYTPEETVTIDRSDAYIPLEESEEKEEETGFLNKVKNFVADDDKNEEEAKLIANNAANRRKLARQKRKEEREQHIKAEAAQDNESFNAEDFIPDFGGLTKGINLPKMPDVSGVMNNIGRSFKGMMKQLPTR